MWKSELYYKIVETAKNSKKNNFGDFPMNVELFYRELRDHDSKSIEPPGKFKMWNIIPEICSIFHKLSYDTFG